MALPTCTELKEAYFDLLMSGAKEVEVGDKVVKYQDIKKLESLIVKYCGVAALEGADVESQAGWSAHKTSFNRRGSTCCDITDDDWRCI